MVRHQVVERVVRELAASGELERLIERSLDSPQTLELTDKVLASEEMQRMLQSVASSPELRRAVARQSAGLAEEVVGGVRSSAVRLDQRAGRRSTLYARHRIPRRRACLRRVRGPCHLRHGERSSELDLLARRRARLPMARRLTARGRLGARRGRLLRPLLERRGTDPRDAAHAPPRAPHRRRRPLGGPRDRPRDRARRSPSSRSSPASSRPSSTSGAARSRTSSPALSSCTTTHRRRRIHPGDSPDRVTTAHPLRREDPPDRETRRPLRDLRCGGSSHLGGGRLGSEVRRCFR